jgi:hypothetical protein
MKRAGSILVILAATFTCALTPIESELTPAQVSRIADAKLLSSGYSLQQFHRFALHYDAHSKQWLAKYYRKDERHERISVDVDDRTKKALLFMRLSAPTI